MSPFDRSTMPRALRPFLDESGRLRSWPARYKVQRLALASVARRFEPGAEYSEKDVNALMMDAHTFADWALLRRSLVDVGMVLREADGSRYRLAPGAEARIAAELSPPSDPA